MMMAEAFNELRFAVRGLVEALMVAWRFDRLCARLGYQQKKFEPLLYSCAQCGGMLKCYGVVGDIELATMDCAYCGRPGAVLI